MTEKFIYQSRFWWGNTPQAIPPEVPQGGIKMGRMWSIKAPLLVGLVMVLGACSSYNGMTTGTMNDKFACNRRITADAPTSIAKVASDTLPVQTWSGDYTKKIRALEDWQGMVIKRSARTGDKVNKGDTLVVPEICPKGTTRGSFITATTR